MRKGIEAEKAALGAAMIDAHGARWVSERLFPEAFYNQDHRKVFEAVKSCQGRGAVDITLVADELTRQNAAIGPKFLAGLQEYAITSDHVDHYGRLVLRDYYEREIHKTADLLKHGENRDELLAKLYELQRARESSQIGGVKTLYDGAGEVMDKLSADDPGLVKVGIPEIDTITNGHEWGDLVIVGARPGVGKTATKLSMALNLARAGKRVAYFSAEMTLVRVSQRLISNYTNVPHWKFRQADRGTNWKPILDGMAALKELPLYINDASNPTLENIRGFSDAVNAQVLFVDYLTRCKLPKADQYRLSVDALVGGLKNYVKDQRKIGYLGAQLSRKADEDRPPELSDLKESGGIEQEADTVILLHASREDIDAKGAIDLRFRVAKNRDGCCGSSTVKFDKPFARVGEVQNEIEMA